MRRSRSRVWLVGLAIVLLAAAAVKASGGGGPCGPGKPAQTLVRNSAARVYASHGTVYGCAAKGRSFRLGSRAGCLRTDLFQIVALAGVTAAYGSERCGVDTGTTQVVVRRLTDGRTISTSAAVSAPGPESYTRVQSIRLKADGAVAWIAVARSLAAVRSRTEVRSDDAHGERLLDSGAAVVPTSLRLRGDEASWQHGSQRRSVRLS